MPPFRCKKPNAIVLDVTGTVAKKAFMAYSEESKNFLKTHIRAYVAECWTRKELRLAINFLRQIRQPKGQGGQGPPPIAEISAPVEKQMESVINNVLWRLEKEGLSSGVGYFHLYMSEWGYRKGILLTPIYEEAAAVLKKWKTEDQIKLYVTLGSASFLKSVFSKTTHGDLLGLIEGHMNLMGRDGTRKDFSKLSQLLGEPPSKILLITRLPMDARLANVAKIPAVIILRADFDPKGVEILTSMDKKGTKTSNKKEATPNTLGNADDENRATASNLESIGVEQHETEAAGSVSKVTEKDLRDFPVIQRLDDLIWIS